jgi:hypothetical protein
MVIIEPEITIVTQNNYIVTHKPGISEKRESPGAVKEETR